VEETRSRVINFRVTQEEYRRLRKASVEGGCRCLSEYARVVLLQSLNSPPEARTNGSNGHEKMLTLELRVGLVELGLSRLEGRVSSLTSREDPVSLAAGAGM
jgi:GTPase involved in cell partitioning and DNA repair